MVRFINRFTGNEMWVSEERVEEYVAAGHKLAAPSAVKEKPAKLKPASKKGKAKK